MLTTPELERDDQVFYDERGNLVLFSLIVRGDPKPQGSKRHVGKGILVESSKKLPGWRAAVRDEVKKMGLTIDGPVQCELTFYLKRPQKHWGTGRNAETLKDSAPHHHTSYPDVDKLARAVFDALVMGGLLSDDSQIEVLIAEKRYAREGGVHIRVRPRP